MTLNIKREITRIVTGTLGRTKNETNGQPHDIPIRFYDNKTTIPLLTAYGCVLMERDTGRNYIYSIVNLTTGNREVISRRTSPLTTSGVDAMIEKMRLSKIAGAGVLEADRALGEKAALENCREILNAVFTEILPGYGFSIRSEQLSLANHILDAASRRIISLAEAEVGTGKTLAYLVPAVIAKRSRLNGYWNMSYYTGSPYIEMSQMPIVIATSSIALQKAIVTEAIPFLSDVLLEHGVIKKPLTAVIRKGREHYLCERKLRNHISFEHEPNISAVLKNLLKPSATIDLAEIDGINSYIKRRISVPERCDKNCPYRESCSYLQFRQQALSPDIDIQVCNHNYLLADTLRRADDMKPLIPNYQMIIIDEAHKFLQAARSMYGVEFSFSSLTEMYELAYSLNFKNESIKTEIQRLAKILSNQGSRLFKRLRDKTKTGAQAQAIAQGYIADDEQDRFSAVIEADEQRNLRNIRDISERLIELINTEEITGNGIGRRAQLLIELTQIRSLSAGFVRHDGLISWLEIDDDCRLCAIPKDLDERLYNDLWSKGMPTVLTSGTMSAAGDFNHIKRGLGINHISRHRIAETSKSSPFDYYEKSMLYISENMPFPNQRDNDYILSIANEIEQLVYASHGHAAVLFTSYKVMDLVYEHLSDRGISFPMFMLNKGGIREIEKFKKSGNGILFAAGALWEGIDIPGDALSMLIIVKLPFTAPDPISEYEQSLYNDMAEYKEFVIKPEMLIKLKQGHGRAIRTETDTAVIAILDSRVNSKGIYRGYVLDGLPECWVTDSIEDVERFYINLKSPEYFLESS